jgi:hypothetical protein
VPGDGGERVDLLSLEEEPWRFGVHEIRPLRLPEEERGRLKQPVADLSLDKLMLQDVLQKKL